MSNLKNHSINFLLLAIMFCYSCANPCNKEEIKQCVDHPIYDKYFGMYQLGNYWIYETEDGLESDSFYIYDKNISNVSVDLTDKSCKRFVEYSFGLKSDTIFSNPKLFYIIFRNKNMCLQLGELIFYYNFQNSDKISININQQNFVSANTEVTPETIFQNEVIQDVLVVTIGLWEFHFAPLIGVIKFTIVSEVGQTKTFNLLNYSIQ